MSLDSRLLHRERYSILMEIRTFRMYNSASVKSVVLPVGTNGPLGQFIKSTEARGTLGPTFPE